MSGSTIIFYLLAALTLVSGVLAVSTRQIFRAAIYLLFSLIGIAGIYFWLALRIYCRCTNCGVCRWYCCADHLLHLSYPAGRGKITQAKIGAKNILPHWLFFVALH